MRILISIFLIFFVSGCSTVGSYQVECEELHAEFKDQVECLKASVHNDSRIRGDGRVRLYLAKADQLVFKVESGELKELDARVELQEYYLALKNDETAERQRDAAIKLMKEPENTNTTCTVYGNTANCKTKQY